MWRDCSDRVATVWATFVGVRSTPVEVTQWVAADGSLVLDQATLTALVDDGLIDGSYDLALDAKAADGTLLATLNVPFTLDTTAPVTTVSGLLDGIRWDAVNGEHLTGTIHNGDAGTSLVYYLDGDDTQAVTLVPSAAGAFNGTLPLAAVALGTHTLTIQTADLAGNVHHLEYTFELKADEPPVDDDVDSETPPPGSPNNQGGSGYPNFGFPGWG